MSHFFGSRGEGPAPSPPGKIFKIRYIYILTIVCTSSVSVRSVPQLMYLYGQVHIVSPAGQGQSLCQCQYLPRARFSSLCGFTRFTSTSITGCLFVNKQTNKPKANVFMHPSRSFYHCSVDTHAAASGCARPRTNSSIPVFQYSSTGLRRNGPPHMSLVYSCRENET